jgi:zinc transport system ATP-binding protein
MERDTLVTMEHVYFSYNDVVVLQDLNLEIQERDFLTIIGPNGGGKTTILKLILGLIEPLKGTIRVFGKPPTHTRKYVGYLPQLFHFDFDFPITVMEVVLMGRLRMSRMGRRYADADMKAASRALEKVGLLDYQTHQIGRLSGGQRQRVFIARALATEPKLLLLDEPVASVDATWQQNFYELLHKLNKKIAIVMVTHDLSVVSTYIDKIACVNKKLYYHGSKKEGMRKIAEMYECPVHLISHDHSHTGSGDRDD